MQIQAEPAIEQMKVTKDNIEHINKILRNKTPEWIVSFALSISKKPILTTNFGPFSASLTHLVNQVKQDIKVIWCDSGFNTSFTNQFAAKLSKRLNLNLQIYTPQPSATLDNFLIKGIPSIEDPRHKAFTELVKLEPFRRALTEHQPDVWFTNLRKGQTKFRDSLDILSFSHTGILKVSPFHYWDDEEILNYLNLNGLPNETRYFDPTKVCQKRECGLHI